MQIQCVASGAHPTATISWDPPPKADFDDNAKPEITHNDKAHTAMTKHTAKYKAQLRDNGKDLK